MTTTTPAPTPAHSLDELAATMQAAAEAAHPSATPDQAILLLLAGSRATCGGLLDEVRRLPDGRLEVPILLSAHGFELLNCAAAHSGWSLSAFILDAAVCRAQDIRTECEHRHIEFANLSNVEPSTADLRRTHGKNGVPELEAVE